MGTWRYDSVRAGKGGGGQSRLLGNEGLKLRCQKDSLPGGRSSARRKGQEGSARRQGGMYSQREGERVRADLEKAGNLEVTLEET